MMDPDEQYKRSELLAKAQRLLDQAKAEKRDLTAAEKSDIHGWFDAIEAIDRRDAEQQTEILKNIQGSPSGPPPGPPGSPEFKAWESGQSMFALYPGKAGYLNLGAPQVVAGLARKIAPQFGIKAVVDPNEVPDRYSPIVMADDPIVMPGRPGTGILDVLPAVPWESPVFRYMRQIERTNRAAPVAPGELKPTSVYKLEPVDARLRVIAHLAEPIDEYLLHDMSGLGRFVQTELVQGIRDALDQQVLYGDGTGENLTGIFHTSGVLQQEYLGSALLSLRRAITKIAALNLTADWFVLNPTDWEAIETDTLTAGQYVLNAEGGRSGLPVDAAAYKLWGIRIVLSTRLQPGRAVLLAHNCAQINFDKYGLNSTTNRIDDDFSRNQIRARVEGRYELAVLRPSGIVIVDLTDNPEDPETAGDPE